MQPRTLHLVNCVMVTGFRKSVNEYGIPDRCKMKIRNSGFSKMKIRNSRFTFWAHVLVVILFKIENTEFRIFHFGLYGIPDFHFGFVRNSGFSFRTRAWEHVPPRDHGPRLARKCSHNPRPPTGRKVHPRQAPYQPESAVESSRSDVMW